ncbi:amino acid synthesis family protein [soil metagenome]
MAVNIRKWVTSIEEVLTEGQRALDAPRRRAVVGVVLSNPFAGRYEEDLSELIDLGETLAAEMMSRAMAALGSPVEAYGKGGIVGEQGEIEHVAAILHPKFGAPVREPVGGKSILPSVKKKAAMGATLDIPIHHTVAMLVRSHFDAVEFRIPDAPAADEIMVALAVADGGRPHARVGGHSVDQVIGEDGLR